MMCILTISSHISRDLKETHKRVKRDFDELYEHESLIDWERYLEIYVLNANLDIIISQLSQSFTSMHENNNLFHPGTLNRADNDMLYQDAQRLMKNYSKDISPSFSNHLLAFRATPLSLKYQKSQLWRRCSLWTTVQRQKHLVTRHHTRHCCNRRALWLHSHYPDLNLRCHQYCYI